MSKAFVAGATGYTGREVVRALVARGVAASAHVRPDSPQLDALTREFAAEGAAVDTTSWDEAALSATLTAPPERRFCAAGHDARGPAWRWRACRSRLRRYGLTQLRAAIASGSRPGSCTCRLGAGRPSGNAYLSARHKAVGEVQAAGCRDRPPFFHNGAGSAEPRPGERIAAR
jgi:hypothetical protein